MALSEASELVCDNMDCGQRLENMSQKVGKAEDRWEAASQLGADGERIRDNAKELEEYQKRRG